MEPMEEESKPREQSTVQYLVEEDKRLFGTINEDIADWMSSCLEEKLSSAAMASMPMADEERVEKMVQTCLLPQYLRGVDVAEVYTKRNVFSISMYPPKKRQLVAKRFFADANGEEEKEEAVLDIAMDMKDSADEHAAKLKQLQQSSSNDENASPVETLERLKQETETLKVRLKEAEVKRAIMEQTLQQTTAALEITQKAVQSEASNIDLDAINDILAKAPRLLQRQDDAKQLIQHMNEIKSNRSEKDREDAEQVFIPTLHKPQQRLDLIEQFERDLQQIGGDQTQLDWLRDIVATD